MTTEIDLRRLELRVSAALTALRDRDGSVFRTETDYFWAFPDPRLGDESTPETSIGQLTWTLDNLDRFDAEAETEPDDIVAMRLRWLAELLTVVAADLVDPPGCSRSDLPTVHDLTPDVEAEAREGEA